MQPCWYCKNIFDCSWGKKNIPRTDWDAVPSKINYFYGQGWTIKSCPGYEDKRPTEICRNEDKTFICPRCHRNTAYPKTTCSFCSGVHIKWEIKNDRHRTALRCYFLKTDAYKELTKGIRLSDFCEKTNITNNTYYYGCKRGFTKKVASKIAKAYDLKITDLFNIEVKNEQNNG